MKRLEDLTKVVEMDVRDCLIYVGPKSCASNVSNELRPNLIHDDSDARLSVGRGLIVWPGTKISPTLKGILEGLKGLRYLRIDADALSQIYPHVGGVVDTLVIRALKRTKVPDGVVFPAARTVMTLDQVVSFKLAQFPRATNFLVRWDSKQSVAEEIARASRVDSLMISHVNSLEEIPERDWSDVEELRIWRTRIRDLKGIQQFSNLKRLVINDNPMLETLEGLQEFKCLNYLAVLHAGKKLKDAGPIRNLKLVGFDVYGCEVAFLDDSLSVFADVYPDRKAWEASRDRRLKARQ
jgi:hypothetical protein